MASTRSRQRKLARDRYQRQMVRRADKQRRRRQVNAAIGAFMTLAVVVVGTVWLLGGFDPDDSAANADAGQCDWLPQEPGPERIETGTPPENPPTSGDRMVTLALDAGDTGSGEVRMSADAGTAPCAVASLEHLAGQGFYDDTTCHELSSGALHCGDPSGTGIGGPTYSFWAGGNIPEVPASPSASSGTGDGTSDDAAEPAYPAGTVAFGDASGGGGSQFMIFYQDHHTQNPLWSVIGEVDGGMDLVESIGEAGTDESSNAPVEEVRVQSLSVDDFGVDSGEVTE